MHHINNGTVTRICIRPADGHTSDAAPLCPGDVNRPNGLGGNAANARAPFTPPDLESDPNTAEGVSAAAGRTSGL